MSIITKVLGLFLGNKYERDIKEITPYVNKIHVESEKIVGLTNDQLRERSFDLKKRIREYVSKEESQIQELKTQADNEVDVYVKEEYYNKIDKIENEIAEKLEIILDESLPEAFAIVKETAKRFKENKELEVTALDYDKELASTRENIVIKGDKAYWNNSWIAGGNPIFWDMCHYDVQLIGGVALHKGKIAEMSTGEGKTLVATLPVFLNALAGRGVHVVTVNDYLSNATLNGWGLFMSFTDLPLTA